MSRRRPAKKAFAVSELVEFRREVGSVWEQGIYIECFGKVWPNWHRVALLANSSPVYISLLTGMTCNLDDPNASSLSTVCVPTLRIRKIK